MQDIVVVVVVESNPTERPHPTQRPQNLNRTSDETKRMGKYPSNPVQHKIVLNLHRNNEFSTNIPLWPHNSMSEYFENLVCMVYMLRYMYNG